MPDIDVDINAELEAIPLKEGESDVGVLGADATPEPTRSEGEVSVPPAIEEKITPEVKIEEAPEEDKPFRSFNTQEEYDEFVEAQKNKTIVENMNKPEEKPAEPLKFFEDDWKPNDWNNFGNAFINNPVVRKALVDTMSPDIKGVLDSLTAKDQKELDTIDKEYDKEYGALATKGLVPKLDTDDGKAVNKQISNIGAEYGVADLPKAYDLWSKIPKEHGGGLEYVAKKTSVQVRKQNSAFLTPPRKAQPSTDKKVTTHEHISNTDMDSLVEEGLEEYA